MDRKTIKDELMALHNEGRNIYFAAVMVYDKDYFKKYNEVAQKEAEEAAQKIIKPNVDYHTWYYTASKAISIFAPERLEEFKSFYSGDKTIKIPADLNYMTAGITHYLQDRMIHQDGKKIDFFQAFESGFKMQINILRAIVKNFDNPFFNLESNIRHDIYKSELDIAKDLNKQGYLRASGAIAGVILEIHLKNLATNRDVMPKKKDPGMSDYNDALKDNIYDTATWRQIQTCGDIRNLCVHPKEAEPTKYQINTIISTVEIIITTYN